MKKKSIVLIAALAAPISYCMENKNNNNNSNTSQKLLITEKFIEERVKEAEKWLIDHKGKYQQLKFVPDFLAKPMASLLEGYPVDMKDVRMFLGRAYDTSEMEESLSQYIKKAHKDPICLNFLQSIFNNPPQGFFSDKKMFKDKIDSEKHPSVPKKDLLGEKSNGVYTISNGDASKCMGATIYALIIYKENTEKSPKLQRKNSKKLNMEKYS